MPVCCHFYNILVNSMPKLAGNDQEDLWTAIYDVYTALAIGIASEKAADNPEFADDENARPSTSEPFEQAYRWFLPRLERGHFTPDFVSKFVSLATCHLECSPLREASCNVVAELGERLKAYADEHLDVEAEAAMRKKLANMNKAGIEAIKYCIAEPGLQVVHEADEDQLSMKSRLNLITCIKQTYQTQINFVKTKTTALLSY